jgi:undecaprenyl pyrophosphate phosphatase UppP
MVLSILPTIGACLIKLVKVMTGQILIEDWNLVAIGSGSAFFFGLISLFLVSNFLRKHTLLPIVVYRILLGILILSM